jgi:hypothetical protein
VASGALGSMLPSAPAGLSYKVSQPSLNPIQCLSSRLRQSWTWLQPTHENLPMNIHLPCASYSQNQNPLSLNILSRI